MRVERGRAPMSEINVTPFVDVMLVLLIIFMVTAPMLKQGLDVNLPQTKGKALPEEQRVEITVTKQGTVQIDGLTVSMEQLGRRLQALRATQPNVFLRADRTVPYGIVAEVMGEVKAAGLEKLGMVTEPKQTLR